MIGWCDIFGLVGGSRDWRMQILPEGKDHIIPMNCGRFINFLKNLHLEI